MVGACTTTIIMQAMEGVRQESVQWYNGPYLFVIDTVLSSAVKTADESNNEAARDYFGGPRDMQYRCSFRRLAWKLFFFLHVTSVLASTTTTTTTTTPMSSRRGPFVQLSVEMAAIVIPRTTAVRGWPAPQRQRQQQQQQQSHQQHHHRQPKQYSHLYSQPHHFSRGGGCASSSSASSTLHMSASNNSKLRYDHPAATSTQHHHRRQGTTATTTFVASIKNPLFSLWRRIRNSSSESSGLSASSTQEQDLDLSVAATSPNPTSTQTATNRYSTVQSENNNNTNMQNNVNGKRLEKTMSPTLTQQRQTSTTTLKEKDTKEPQPSLDKEEDLEQEKTTLPTEGRKRSTVIELTFLDPSKNINNTYKALNTCRRKFEAYLNYLGANSTIIKSSQITSEHIDMNDHKHADKRDEWRMLWKAGRLLTDRTEFLAVYHSDNQDGDDDDKDKNNVDNNKNGQSSTKRRGGFADLLHLYTERLMGILKDEEEDFDQDMNGSDTTSISSSSNNNNNSSDVLGVRTWLEENYGKDRTHGLMASQFQQLAEEEQIARLQHFADWFRSIMPYYYDKCGSCFASFKDESSAAAAEQQQQQSSQNDDKDDCTTVGSTDNEANCLEEEDDERDDDDDDQGTFLGYIYPNEKELLGKASRTELYQCHKCHAFTRFPRFNSAHAIIEHKRGRCGEYSTLVYRFLRALDLESRWVVDWADHVWAEVLLEGGWKNGIFTKPRWIHLDPCEAAVDNPHLYQGWGKKQTYVIGLYSPTRSTSRTGTITLAAPVVEDLTSHYTTDDKAKIASRRDESPKEVELAINNAITELEIKLGVENSTQKDSSQ